MTRGRGDSGAEVTGVEVSGAEVAGTKWLGDEVVVGADVSVNHAMHESRLTPLM